MKNFMKISFMNTDTEILNKYEEMNPVIYKEFIIS